MSKKHNSSGLPDVAFVFIALNILVGGLAWLFRLSGVTYEQWPLLKWLCSIPLVIIIVIFLPFVIEKARSIGEMNGNNEPEVIFTDAPRTSTDDDVASALIGLGTPKKVASDIVSWIPDKDDDGEGLDLEERVKVALKYLQK